MIIINEDKLRQMMRGQRIVDLFASPIKCEACGHVDRLAAYMQLSDTIMTVYCPNCWREITEVVCDDGSKSLL